MTCSERLIDFCLFLLFFISILFLPFAGDLEEFLESIEGWILRLSLFGTFNATSPERPSAALILVYPAINLLIRRLIRPEEKPLTPCQS